MYVVSPWWNRSGSVLFGPWRTSLNQIQGRTTVRESYPHDLEQGPLLSTSSKASFPRCVLRPQTYRRRHRQTRCFRGSRAALFGDDNDRVSEERAPWKDSPINDQRAEALTPSRVGGCTEFPIPSFIEVFRISFREFPRLVGHYCS